MFHTSTINRIQSFHYLPFQHTRKSSTKIKWNSALSDSLGRHSNKKWFFYLGEVILFDEKFHNVWHESRGVAHHKDDDHHHRSSAMKIICVSWFEHAVDYSRFACHRVYLASLFFNSCSLMPATRRKLFGLAGAELELPVNGPTHKSNCDWLFYHRKLAYFSNSRFSRASRLTFAFPIGWWSDGWGRLWRCCWRSCFDGWPKMTWRQEMRTESGPVPQNCAGRKLIRASRRHFLRTFLNLR